MKPQCNTSAECLRELARVMDQFGFESSVEAVNSNYVRFNGVDFDAEGDYFTHPHAWKFAIAEVEGKPVFVGDELYDPFGSKYSAVPDIQFHLLSWNPPKPKTVMVELPYEYVVDYACCEVAGTTFTKACKKALEQIK